LVASHRGGLRADATAKFLDELASIPTEPELIEFLSSRAGQKGSPGGLSNSELGLAAGLWAAARAGSEINLLGLKDVFRAGSKGTDYDQLASALRDTDGILLSTPVYFGDRSSLAGELLDLIRRDRQLRSDLEGKVCGGIAVGAKRNGGQETTLIYQLTDLVNNGLLGVGNDSDTTAQYGGTGHAGDKGSLLKDDYGLSTAQGVGRRLAHVAGLLRLGRRTELRGKVRLLFLILQDQERMAAALVRKLSDYHPEECETTILDLTEQQLSHCLACDTCPTRVAVDSEYTCKVVNDRVDDMARLHHSFLDQDAIIPVVYSALDADRTISNYHVFLERTRYLRRGDFLFSDRLIAPLVIEEVGARQHFDLRMITSWVRHHTIISRPLVVHKHQGEILNWDSTRAGFSSLILHTQRLAAGRLQMFRNGKFPGITRYNPVGYILPNSDENEAELMQARNDKVSERHARLAQDAHARLASEELAGV
jgi:multimeric flavodoxin WrbA